MATVSNCTDDTQWRKNPHFAASSVKY